MESRAEGYSVRGTHLPSRVVIFRPSSRRRKKWYSGRKEIREIFLSISSSQKIAELKTIFDTVTQKDDTFFTITA